jgi:hypothetical protein
MKFVNKELKASFELSDGVTQRQMEMYELKAIEVLEEHEQFTTAITQRAHVIGVMTAGIYSTTEGCPKTIDDVDSANVTIMGWMGAEIEAFIKGLRYIDPNLSRNLPSPEKESKENLNQ